MSEIDPITREEILLNSIAEGTDSGLEPITRQEMWLSAIAGETELPADMNPITREEIFLQKVLDNGTGGGEAEGTVSISITENGTITRNVARYASAEITTNVPNPSTGTKQISSNGTYDVTNFASADVSVPNSYTSSDEGKVVSDGALVSQTNRQVTANGTYDTTLNDSVEVNVPTGITPTGTKQISIIANGTTTEDVTNYASAEITVNVPNSYTASDEGKVVSSGALVSQSSQTVTENGTYDTTLKNEVVVNVPSGGGGYSLDDLADGTEPSGVLDISVPIRTYAFIMRSNITKVTGISTSVGTYAFHSCDNLTEVDLPNCTSVGTYCFYACSKLESVNMPNVITIGEYAFRNSALPTIVLPKYGTNNGAGVTNVFRDCKKLEAFDAYCTTSVINGAFQGDEKLSTIILRRSTLVNLDNIYAFAGSPFASDGTGGTLYVPQALISSYQSATNWSTILGYTNNQILKIEGSIYETQYADGTPISA